MREFSEPLTDEDAERLVSYIENPVTPKGHGEFLGRSQHTYAGIPERGGPTGKLHCGSGGNDQLGWPPRPRWAAGPETQSGPPPLLSCTKKRSMKSYSAVFSQWLAAFPEARVKERIEELADANPGTPRADELTILRWQLSYVEAWRESVR